MEIHIQIEHPTSDRYITSPISLGNVMSPTGGHEHSSLLNKLLRKMSTISILNNKTCVDRNVIQIHNSVMCDGISGCEKYPGIICGILSSPDGKHIVMDLKNVMTHW